MNRDEKLTRVRALPPLKRESDGRTLMHPVEPGGGTWISLNDAGNCLALVNWYSVSARAESPISRGEVVRKAAGADTIRAVDVMLEKLPLNRINPFRLVGVFSQPRTAVEWQWDLRKLVRKNHAWKARQWISSGFDEPMAQRLRKCANKSPREH